jgi:hypothetical protein
VGMKITAWDYPEGESLNELIDKVELHPITALSSLSEEKKRLFLEQGIVFCKNLNDCPKSS